MIFSLLQILIPDIIFLTGIWLIVARDKSLRLIIAGATVSAFRLAILIINILSYTIGTNIPVAVGWILTIGSVCSHIAFYIVCFTSRFAGTNSRLVHASFYLYVISYGIYYGIYYGGSGSSSTFSYLSFALNILRLITYLLLLCAGIRAKKITEKYLERAEELFLTGEQYLSGAGAEKDFVKAADCFIKSAKLGHAEACNELGICYQRGDGVEKDNKKAAYWYKKGAGWGHDLAQYNLADCYREGIGVKKNAQKAEHWYNKSGLSPDDSSVYRIQPQRTPAVNTIEENINNDDRESNPQRAVNRREEDGLE